MKTERLTAVWRNGGCCATYDSLVVGSSAVLRLNFCAKNPPPSPSPKPLALIPLFSDKKIISSANFWRSEKTIYF